MYSALPRRARTYNNIIIALRPAWLRMRATWAGAVQRRVERRISICAVAVVPSLDVVELRFRVRKRNSAGTIRHRSEHTRGGRLLTLRVGSGQFVSWRKDDASRDCSRHRRSSVANRALSPRGHLLRADSPHSLLGILNHPLPPPVSVATPARFRRDGRSPLYQEIARWLEQKVRSGEYARGSRIPGDMQLATELGVSVITVRAAMRTLRERHLIERYPGKGTFVLDSSKAPTVWGLGSTDDLLAMGYQTSIKLLRKGYVRPPEEISAKFGLPTSRKVYWCETLRIANGQPFEFTDVYLPPISGDVIARIDLVAALEKRRLVSAVVQDMCKLIITDVRQAMGAELAQDRVAKMLKVLPGTPLLTVERDHYTADGTLIQAAHSRHRVDHFKYTTNLKRVAG